MDLSSSELSSGCESGWTVYFDQFSESSYQYNRNYSRKVEEDEDLSMVSDASSAPPHFHEEVNCFYRPPEPVKEKRKGKEQHSHLDDTATSPLVNYYKHAPGFSQDLSATNVKEKSSFSSKNFGFFKSSKK
ncbi:hypothetical protein LIER_09250 [Lithospermum erythrorhizon]|uniref:Uncharacterized protein n=1 Tax=Lithospermum erythrorhizon TaxID=34254 RepID=A0AAV3PH81_LITER